MRRRALDLQAMFGRRPRPRGAAPRRTWLVGGLWFISGFGVAAWLPFVPQVQSALGLSDGQLGAAFLGMPAGLLVGVAAAVPLAARLGSRVLAVAATAGYAGSVVLPALAGGTVSLMIALSAIGLCSGLLDVATSIQAVTWERLRGRVVTGYLSAIFVVGALSGALGSAAAIAAGVGALRHLAVVAVLGIVGTLACAPGLLHTSQTVKRLALPTRATLVLGAIGFLALMQEDVIGHWSSVYLLRDLDVMAPMAGFGYIVCTAAMVVGRLAQPRLLDRFGPVRYLASSALTCVAGAILILAAPGLGWTLTGFATLGLGLSGIWPTVVSLAGRAPERDLVVGGVTFVGFLGFLTGPSIVGGISAAAGSLRWGLGVLVLGALGMVALAPLVRNRGAASDGPQD